MFQMQNFINKSSVLLDPSLYMKTSEYFLLLLLQIPEVAAAKNFLQFDVDMLKSQVEKSIMRVRSLLKYWN